MVMGQQDSPPPLPPNAWINHTHILSLQDRIIKQVCLTQWFIIPTDLKFT